MKRIGLILAFFLLTGTLVYGQTDVKSTAVTDAQWNDLLKAVDGEDWTAAFSLSSDYLKRMSDEKEGERAARLRYIYLYSAAGKVSAGLMSYDELEKAIKELTGKQIVFPYRKIKLHCQGEFNFICVLDDKENETMVTAANKNATTIFAFEYTEYKDKVDLAKRAGKKASISGKIKEIAPNPNKSRI